MGCIDSQANALTRATSTPRSTLDCALGGLLLVTGYVRRLLPRQAAKAGIEKRVPCHDPQRQVVPRQRASGSGGGFAISARTYRRGGEMGRSDRSPDLDFRFEGVLYDERMVGRLLEEAPGVYRDLRVVMEAQRELVRVVRRLRPVISYKGG